MYQIAYTKTALKDIPKLKAAHLDKKAKALIEVIRQNPYQTPPTYEKLVGNMYGLYSRRINYQHRLVYKVHGSSRSGRITNDKKQPPRQRVRNAAGWLVYPYKHIEKLYHI